MSTVIAAPTLILRYCRGIQPERTVKQAALLLLVLNHLPGLWGQPHAAPTFEVATVKLSASGYNGFRGGCRGIDSQRLPKEMAQTPLGRCVLTDGRLSHLIMMAYG